MRSNVAKDERGSEILPGAANWRVDESCGRTTTGSHSLIWHSSRSMTCQSCAGSKQAAVLSPSFSLVIFYLIPLHEILRSTMKITFKGYKDELSSHGCCSSLMERIACQSIIRIMKTLLNITSISTRFYWQKADAHKTPRCKIFSWGFREGRLEKKTNKQTN